MAEIIRMPKLSDTMTEGVVAAWHKNVGDKVSSGELLAEIESDKATMEFESFLDGTLLYIGVQKGKAAKVDSILAILGEKGEDISELLKQDQAPPAIEEKQEAPATKPAPVAEQPKKETPVPVVQKTVATPVFESSSNGRLKASPLAKKLANEKGIDLARVAGSGDGGRVVRRDVESFTPEFAAATAVERYHDVEISQMRKTIARRLAESKFTAPHFYLTMKIDMDA